MSTVADKPLIYACSGCTRAGRLSYDVAMGLRADGFANVGCLPALALGVQEEVERAQQASVMLLEGCQRACGNAAASLYNIPIQWRLNLADMLPQDLQQEPSAGQQPSADQEPSADYSLTELYAVMQYVHQLIACRKL